MMNLILVRNAEHEDYNQCRWPTDNTGLSTLGVEQSKRVCASLDDSRISAVYASPTTRAIETVRELSEMHQLTIEKVEEFSPLDMGKCTGMTYDETRCAIGPEAWKEMLSAPASDKRYFINGETLLELANRSWKRIRRIAAEAVRKDGAVVIATHEEVIGALLCSMAEMPLSRLWWWGGRLRPPLYASITKARWADGRWTLVEFGATEHLEGL